MTDALFLVFAAILFIICGLLLTMTADIVFAQNVPRWAKIVFSVMASIGIFIAIAIIQTIRALLDIVSL